MNKKLQNCGRDQLFLFFEPPVHLGEPPPILTDQFSPLESKRSPVESLHPNNYITESQLSSSGPLELERISNCHLELQFVADDKHQSEEVNGGDTYLVRSLSPLTTFSPNGTSVSRYLPTYRTYCL